jgi:early secretory antigenic target protein ESAT-6
MTRYQVDSEAVLNSGAAIHASIGRIQAEVSGMYSQLNSLESSWSGQASSAFQGIVGDWRITQQRVEESLAAIQQALATAGRQYAEVEQQNSRLFSA